MATTKVKKNPWLVKIRTPSAHSMTYSQLSTSHLAACSSWPERNHTRHQQHRHLARNCSNPAAWHWSAKCAPNLQHCQAWQWQCTLQNNVQTSTKMFSPKKRLPPKKYVLSVFSRLEGLGSKSFLLNFIHKKHQEQWLPLSRHCRPQSFSTYMGYGA